DRPPALALDHRRQALAQLFDHLVGEVLVDDAADVVLAKDLSVHGGRDLTRARASDRARRRAKKKRGRRAKSEPAPRFSRVTLRLRLDQLPADFAARVRAGVDVGVPV